MSNDKLALDLLKTIQAQKAEISSIQRANWQTSCSYKINGHTVNLQVVTDVSKLVRVAADVIFAKEFHHKSCRELGLDITDTIIDGYSADQWLEDCKTRLARLQLSQKKARLQQMEDKVNTLISPEKRAALELQAIAKELG